jgi:hypothetical protein
MATGQARIGLGAQDNTRAAFASVARNFSSLGNQASGIQGKMTGIATAIASSFAVIGALNIVNQLDQLNDLSKKTGIAAVTLGGIGFAALQAGGDLETASKATGKLNRTLAEAAAGSQSAAEPFKLLGISVTDAAGKTKAADVVLIELANSFEEMEDGPEKAALAVRIFGKAGEAMIPLLDEGGKSLQKNIAYFEQYSRITPEAVAASDQFNDTLTKIKLLSAAAGTELVSRFLPTMQAIADEMLDSKEKGAGYIQVIDGIGAAFRETARIGAAFATTFVLVGKVVASVFAALSALGEGGGVFSKTGRTAFSEALAAAREDMNATVDDYANFSKKLDAFGQAAGKTTGDFARGDRAKGNGKKAAPRLSDSGAGSEALAVLKKQLDAELKSIEQAETAKKALIAYGNDLARSEFEDGLNTQVEFFRRAQAARADNLAATTGALDKEIAALTAFKSNPAVKQADRIDAETKIADAVAKRAQAVQKASQEAVLAAAEEARAIESLQDRYADVQASILQLQGKTLEAGKARIAQQAREALKVINQAGGDPAQAQQLAKLLTDTDRLSEARRQYGILTEAARDGEEALILTVQEGNRSELETLTAIGAERQKSLAQLQELATAAAQLAEELQTPEAIAFARQLGLAFKRAAAEVDPLLQQTRALGQEMGESIAGGLGEAVVEGKNLRDTLKGIEKDLINILIRTKFTKPLGDFLGGTIGGNGQASGGGGWLGSLFGNLFGGGGGSSAGFGTGSAFGNMDFGGFFATGGTLQPGHWGIAGENGPEPIFAGAVPVHVTPNGGRAAVVVNLHQSFAPGTDKSTINQAAQAAGMALATAQRRNG